MEKQIVKFTKLDKSATVPVYGTPFAAGADLRALSDKNITIEPGETVFVHTGLAMQIPDGLVGLIYARSGLACKRGLAPANCVGVIDSDYRGEIMVALHNYSNTTQEIEPNERVAQIVIAPYIAAEFEETETLDDTIRGEGGFGSTGKQ
ncbi:MAG: dUTP diphosphatase [Clostridia bacterium]|nr:dUTP diphosphatase [Clostridia bacterium]